MSDDLMSENPPRKRVPSQESNIIGPDPLTVLVTGYCIGSLLHGGLELSLISIEASTNDNRSTFVVEGKTSRKRLRITVREERETI